MPHRVGASAIVPAIRSCFTPADCQPVHPERANPVPSSLMNVEPAFSRSRRARPSDIERGESGLAVPAMSS
jgi:hypothetical protein